MHNNEGTADRVIRIIIAANVISLFATEKITGTFGIVPIV